MKNTITHIVLVAVVAAVAFVGGNAYHHQIVQTNAQTAASQAQAVADEHQAEQNKITAALATQAKTLASKACVNVAPTKTTTASPTH